jgi:predicted amidohydrolase
MRWLPSRAHDNGMFLVFSNGVGVDDDEIRTGHSMILDPYGSVLAETGKAGDDMVIADLDPELLEKSTVPTGLERSTRELRFKSH